MSPELCRDIDRILDQWGGLQDVLKIVEEVREKMEKQKPLHSITVETVIVSYTTVELRKRKAG